MKTDINNSHIYFIHKTTQMLNLALKQSPEYDKLLQGLAANSKSEFKRLMQLLVIDEDERLSKGKYSSTKEKKTKDIVYNIIYWMKTGEILDLDKYPICSFDHKVDFTIEDKDEEYFEVTVLGETFKFKNLFKI